MIEKIGIKNYSIEPNKSEPGQKITSFADTLKNYVKDVNDKQIYAEKSIEKFLKGEEKDIHNTMISIQKADISLQLMMQIRNKIMSAYQEIMRIQV